MFHFMQRSCLKSQNSKLDQDTVILVDKKLDYLDAWSIAPLLIACKPRDRQTLQQTTHAEISVDSRQTSWSVVHSNNQYEGASYVRITMVKATSAMVLRQRKAIVSFL